MATSNGTSPKWLAFSFTLAVAAVSVTSAAIYVAPRNNLPSLIFQAYFSKKQRDLYCKVRELQVSLKTSLENCAAERQGRIRAQQGDLGSFCARDLPLELPRVRHFKTLRKALVQAKPESLELTSYPMKPIAIIQSCFSTRNGTPRQPLIVPLARASLVFNTSRVPPASLEGLEDYSHCWIIYVFHLNTNLDKLWIQPSKSKFKAKVRVPRLKGERKGVFATRSPHRPCPIGLTVAKVEAIKGHRVLLSGVDLVDGTPVLDVKPYLPYCDSINGATVPTWVSEENRLSVTFVSFSEGFSSSLSECWATIGKKSLYASPDEFQGLIKQVLSWDIRSVSQRNRPHNSNSTAGNGEATDNAPSSYDEEASDHERDHVSPPSGDIIYHLILEGLNVSYRIDFDGNVVVVENVTISSNILT